MNDFAEKLSHQMFAVSFCGLALFVPFSISGANIFIMLGFVAALIGIVAVPEIRARIFEIRKDPMLFGCVILVVSAIPSVLMSEDISRAREDWESYWLLLIYFLVAYNLTSPKLRRTVFWILFGSTSLACLMAITQYRGGIDFFFIKIAPQTHRPSGTLFTMTFAGILCQLITVNFSILLGHRGVSKTALATAAGVAVQITGIILTLTRGAWVALLGGITSVVILFRRKKVYFIAVLLILITAILALRDSRVQRKIASATGMGGEPTEVNVTTRYVLWDISWELIKSHPILGVGMGDFTIEAEKRVAERHVETTVDSHNVYLQILATRGLVGFIPFLYFWFVLLRSLWRVRQGIASRSGFGWHYVTGVMGATIAVLIGALTENNIDDSEVFIAFMLIVGIAKSFERCPELHTTRSTE
ncbi:MAG: O-antigen ligase family protein [Candidatus Latescibacterota bacterium]|nr:MAG: O-antigen ligase family protein [Candidatus Latescibacterota bacterium]